MGEKFDIAAFNLLIMRDVLFDGWFYILCQAVALLTPVSTTKVYDQYWNK